MAELELELVSADRIAAVTRAIDAGLIAYNEALAGPLEIRPLVVCLRAAGAVVGGLVGETYWNLCHVDRFWVAEAHRGQGRGRALLGAAEHEARARGASCVHLDTFSFQAPGFYEKLGYQRFGELKGLPPGATRFFYAKTL